MPQKIFKNYLYTYSKNVENFIQKMPKIWEWNKKYFLNLCLFPITSFSLIIFKMNLQKQIIICSSIFFYMIQKKLWQIFLYIQWLLKQLIYFFPNNYMSKLQINFSRQKSIKESSHLQPAPKSAY